MPRLEATPTPGPGLKLGLELGLTPPTASVRVADALQKAAAYSHNQQAHLREGVALTIRRLQNNYDLDTGFWFDNRFGALPTDDSEDSWGYGAFRRMVHDYVRREDQRRQKSCDAGESNAEMELGHAHEAEIVSLLMRVVQGKMKAVVDEFARKEPDAQVDALRVVAPELWRRTETMVPAASFTLEKIAAGSNVQIVTSKRDRILEAEILNAVGWCVCPPSCEDLMTMILTACGRFDDGLVAEAVQRWRTVFSGVIDRRMLFFTVAEMATAVLYATLRDRGDLRRDELGWVIDLCKTNALKIDGLVHFLSSTCKK